MENAVYGSEKSTDTKEAVSSLERIAEEVSHALGPRPKLADMFRKCFMSTVETTTELLDDGTTFILTGDIPAMWLRDSSAQVSHYIPFAAGSPILERLIEGLVRRQLMYISIDPYANAFNKEPTNSGHRRDKTKRNPWIWERKYEVDSLCYPIFISYRYWKCTGRTAVFGEIYREAVQTIIGLWEREQRHHDHSLYRFERRCCPPSDTLPCRGAGAPVRYTGMTWSGFRPSDDACAYGYLIPSNMFASVVLGQAAEIMKEVYGDTALRRSALALREQIDLGIKTYGIVHHPDFGDIYAYETDGYGNYNLMDDANVPSLMSLPYLGYCGAKDPVYRNTRRFILSRSNPFFFEGKYAKGVGSPHTQKGYIWQIGLIVQALTSIDEKEIECILDVLENTDAGTGYMHESFDANDPNAYSRPWFAWANSLFAELICRHYHISKQ